MNFLEIPVLLFTKSAAEMAVEGRAKAVGLVRLLYVSVAAPVVLLALGAVLGRWGDWLGWSWLTAPASFLVYVAAVLGSVLWAWLWVRAAVYANLFLLASKVTGSLSEKLPHLGEKGREETRDLVKWARGLAAWFIFTFAAVLFIHRVDNVWRHVDKVAVLLVVSLALAMMSSWFSKPWGRVIGYSATLAFACFTLLSYASPAFAEVSGDFLGWSLGRGGMSAVTEARRDEAEALDRALLDKLYAEVNDLRRRGIEQCSGEFCPGDEEKVADLEARITRLKRGTYWNRQLAGSQTTNLTSDTEASPTEVSPPPPAPKKMTTGKPAAVRLRRGAQPPAESSRPSGERLGGGVWDELSKYPNIR